MGGKMRSTTVSFPFSRDAVKFLIRLASKKFSRSLLYAVYYCLGGNKSADNFKIYIVRKTGDLLTLKV
jgi:hypothetical protein